MNNLETDSKNKFILGNLFANLPPSRPSPQPDRTEVPLKLFDSQRFALPDDAEEPPPLPPLPPEDPGDPNLPPLPDLPPEEPPPVPPDAPEPDPEVPEEPPPLPPEDPPEPDQFEPGPADGG